MFKELKTKKGFTLIELLVVIAILAVLLAIVLIAINPAKQTRDTRDTKRKADVLTILNAVNQYYVSTGAFPPGTPLTAGASDNISSTGVGTSFCTALVPDYVAELPRNPSLGDPATTSCTGNWDTGYQIRREANDRITIFTAGESVATISATR